MSRWRRIENNLLLNLELDQYKLPELLGLKYGTLADAIERLGSSDQIRDTFIGFQKHLYL